LSSAQAGEALTVLADTLGLTLSEQQIDSLLSYLSLLQRWNATHNLTAVRSAEGMWAQHLADCLAVVSPLVARLDTGRLLDVGSGGGLPGIVIAICLPAIEVVCVDSVGKKAAFIRQVAGELRLSNLHSVHARVEAMSPGGFDVVVSRAFASLADFVALTRAQLRHSGVWMAMKGQRPDAEIAALPSHARLFHVEQLHVPGLDAQRCLVWMRPAPHEGTQP
jgi:16S rRNA (guanine527-N7)-methyltransferase